MQINDNYNYIAVGRFLLLVILTLIVFNFFNISYAETDTKVLDTKKADIEDIKKKETKDENIVNSIANVKENAKKEEKSLNDKNTITNKSEENNIVKTTDKNNTVNSKEEKKNLNNTTNTTNTTNTNNISDRKNVVTKKEEKSNDLDKLEISDVEINNVGASTKESNLQGTITEIRAESNGYIIGNIRTNAKLDGKKLLVVDEDGKKYETWVVSSGNSNYYFDKNMSGLPKNKKYHFEIVIGNESVKVSVANKNLGYVGAYIVSIKNGGVLTYTRQAIRANITEIRQESNGYIIGNIWSNTKLDGNKLLLVDEDGKKSGTWVVSSGNNNYYFDKNMSGMSKDKKYHFEIVTGSESTNVTVANKHLGYIGNYNTKIIDNNIVYTRQEVRANITEIRQESNGYIIGNIWSNTKLDGNKLLLVDEDGKKSGTWVVSSGNNNYYFDKNMSGVSKDKKYHFEIVTGKESVNVTVQNKNLGYIGNYNTKIIDNNIVYTRQEVRANITEIRQESNGYIIGNIWSNTKLDGNKLLLVDEDGNKSGTWVVSSGNNNYYFDKNMSGMSKDKKYDVLAYYYENDKLVGRIINLGNADIGSTSRAKVTTDGYNINFEKFDGNTRIDVENIRYFNSNGSDYLSTVFTVYLEDDNGDKKTNNISKLYLIEKGTNNSKEFWYKKLDNNKVYADINVSDFDKNKKYIIKLGDIVLNNNKYIGASLVYNSNDIGNSRFMKAKYRGNELSFEKYRFEHGVYGKSERGRDLEYYKLGSGNNVAFFTFAMHGFEDNFDHDGAVLVKIAEVLKDKLMYEEDILSKWTIYIFKSVNPDGVAEGWTRNGPGRTTVGSGIDLNRQWQIPGRGYKRYTDSRNYNGNSPFIVPEAYNLRDFILAHKTSNGQNIAIDTHGWLNGTYGDSWLGSFYRNEFGMYNHNNSYGTQYFANWAKNVLPNSRSVLVELPNVWSYGEAMNKSFPETHSLATMKMLRSV